MKIIPALKYDLLFQRKQKIYHLYLGITLLYIIGLQVVPWGIKKSVITLMIISDPVLLGFFFIGGIILLEKDNNILNALFVTPLGITEYIFSKALSLGGVTLAASLAIVLFSSELRINFLLFVVTVILSSCIFTFAGIIITAKIKTLNQYMFTSSCFEILLFLPLINFFGFYDHFIFRIIPSDATINLIKASLNNNNEGIIFSFLVLSFWFAVLFYYSKLSVNKNIILNVGGAG